MHLQSTLRAHADLEVREDDVPIGGERESPVGAGKDREAHACQSALRRSQSDDVVIVSRIDAGDLQRAISQLLQFRAVRRPHRMRADGPIDIEDFCRWLTQRCSRLLVN